MIKFAALRPALLLTAAFVIGAPGHAQEAAATLTAAASADDLGEIVVTAERRSENLQKVPLSVAVVSGDQARAYGSGGEDTLLSLSGRVPSLYIESTTGRIFPRFYIRGLGNVDFYLGASQPVSIIQDDVVLEHVVLKSNPVYDVSQIEVLRGPQGSLFGRNTTAGIIKFDTVKPSNDFTARADASYGSFNTVTFDGVVGGPIIADKLSFRISGLYQHRDDWVDNTFAGVSGDGTVTPKKNAMGGYDERDVRAQLLLTPSDRVSMLLSAHGRWYDGTSTLFYRGALKKGSNDASATPRDQVAFDEANNNHQKYTTYGTSMRIGIDLGGATLTSISAYENAHGYSRGDTDGGAAANFPVGGNPNGFGQSQGRLRDLDQLTQEIRLSSNGDTKFKWQVGAMWFDQRDITEFDQRGVFLLPGVTGANPNNFVVLRNRNDSYAAFGQLSYEIVPNVTITVGGRETKDTKRTQLLKTANTPLNVVTYKGRTNVRLSDSKPSWDGSILWQATPDLSLYARAARGFRGPTIQGRSAVFNADFTTATSETNTSYEAGFKSSLFDNTLRFNASGFTYTVKNIQLNGNDSNGNGVLFNADKAKAYGAEADVEWRPLRGLLFTGGASYLHSKIEDKNVFAQACSLNGVLTCTVQDPLFTRGSGAGTTYFAQIDGNPLPNAPKYNLNVTARYGIPVGNGELFAATDWNLQGYTNLVLYKTREFYSKNNFEGGVKVGYSTDKYELAVFARNVTNEKNLKGVIENYNAAVFNDPRIIGVSAGIKLR